jgi:hypothetical protein
MPRNDGRDQGRGGTYTFHGTLADIYLACTDRPTAAAAVRDKLRLNRPVGEIEDVFREFQRRGLMFSTGPQLRFAVAEDRLRWKTGMAVRGLEALPVTRRRQRPPHDPSAVIANDFPCWGTENSSR